MKNYIHDIISRYIKHDYPKEVDQDFRAWYKTTDSYSSYPTGCLESGGSIADRRIFGCRLSGCAEPAGTGRIAGLYPYCRDKEYYFAGWHAGDDQLPKHFALSPAIYR